MTYISWNDFSLWVIKKALILWWTYVSLFSAYRTIVTCDFFVLTMTTIVTIIIIIKIIIIIVIIILYKKISLFRTLYFGIMSFL